MFLKKLAVHQIIWLATVTFLVVSCVWAYQGNMSYFFLIIPFYLLFILSLVFTIATPNQILIQRKWRIHFGDSPFFSHTIKDSPFSFFSSAL